MEGFLIESLSIDQARKLALRSQGFTRTRFAPALDLDSSKDKKRVGVRSQFRALEQMGVLQIDAINTVIRSHYMPLYSRLGHYDRSLLDARVFDSLGQSASKRSTFEYWAHECSVVPMHFYPLFRWRMNEAKRGVGIYKQLRELAKRNPSLIKKVKSRIEQDGALTTAELSEGKRGKGMWEWSTGKQALEYLFSTGELVSLGRRGFQRVYELRENAIPHSFLEAPLLPKKDAQKQLILIAAQASGVATAYDLRDYFRLSAHDCNVCIEEMVEERQLVRVDVEGFDKVAYSLPNVTIPRKVEVSALLTPFDPLVWCRQRASRLFGFDYRIEIYVPASKRKFGYYVLPYLLGNELVARVDIKADRVAGTLAVLGAWIEHAQDIEKVAHNLAAELNSLALWLALDNVSVRSRGNLARTLRNNLNVTQFA